ncbi:uncharacterized protein LOC120276195 [Dioscorea cayenensis subsp. rotundata]|uniref:Uncharacterized protein LOC120276195 n=1 Tax=Dioscorea cayennensis subsp. rotundata TaxID=55577 RepID=A0AB40CFV6_DIOCR|nr:uncharacterized protein LOC120276195 [Dioscorea cayenensis subsp. rotundata]
MASNSMSSTGYNSTNSDFNESDYDLDDDDDQAFEINVNLGIERDMDSVHNNLGSGLGNVVDSDVVNEESGYDNSDSLQSVVDSDDASNRSFRKFLEFNIETDMENPMLAKGMLFPSRESLKEAVKQYGRKNSKCYRAKTLALEVVFGNAKEQYSRIYDYLQELWETNEGTTTICRLEARLFLRMYVCLQGCKSGFKTGCRPIISLDACFLKGYYRGHLMAAVGIVANDCMYPIAFAAIESENFDSWCWFIDLMIQNLEIVNSYHWSFMSDKQKLLALGLVDALMELVPNVEHRNCVRHLYTNLKSQPNTKGKAIKDCLWKVARATYMKEFEDAMSKMRSLSKAAHKWILGKDPRQWSKAHFSTLIKCDMLLNNLCECFNKYILEARGKPILTMMETIRTKLMQMIAMKEIAAHKYTGVLCPKIQKKVDKIIEESVRCWARHAGGAKYQVSCGPADQHVVDLECKNCSYRKWDLIGIPCTRAVVVMFCTGEMPELYVDPCYHKETQLQIYLHFINPIRGANQWSVVQGMEPIIPPMMRRPLGKPHKSRRKGSR